MSGGALGLHVWSAVLSVRKLGKQRERERENMGEEAEILSVMKWLDLPRIRQ